MGFFYFLLHKVGKKEINILILLMIPCTKLHTLVLQLAPKPVISKSTFTLYSYLITLNQRPCFLHSIIKA